MKRIVFFLIILTCLPVFAEDTDIAANHIRKGVKYYERGHSEYYTNLNLMKKAITEFQKALVFDTKSAEARYYLGLTCLAMDDMKCALAQLEILKGLREDVAQSLQTEIDAYQPPEQFQYSGTAKVKQYKGTAVNRKSRAAKPHNRCHA